MERATFHSAYCRRMLLRISKVKNQRYCDDKTCQLARKRKWQGEKLEADSDHRVNKRDSKRGWRSKILPIGRSTGKKILPALNVTTSCSGSGAR